MPSASLHKMGLGSQNDIPHHMAHVPYSLLWSLGSALSTHLNSALCPTRKLISISFGDLNPFPLRQIRNRRAYHLEKVRLELTELEAIREDFLRERDTSPDKGELVSDEEEDT